MTLREDIIKYSGETLEEGRFGRGLTIALMIAAIAFGAFKGAPVAKQAYDKYKNASTMSIERKYRDADFSATYEDINGDYKYNCVFFKTWYYGKTLQPTLRMTVLVDKFQETLRKDGEFQALRKAAGEILDQTDVYINTIKKNTSKLEKYLSKDTYLDLDELKTLKIELNFSTDSWAIKDENQEKMQEFAADLAKNIYRDVAAKFGVNQNNIIVTVNHNKKF